MIISDKNKRIGYMSYYCVGKKHDYRFLKDEFPPDKDWFSTFDIKVDLGYLGIMNDYKCKSISIPHKKPKKGALTMDQKKENRRLASERIVVEHSIGGIKRYRILSDRLRLHDLDFYDDILGVCAGLWNFHLSAK